MMDLQKQWKWVVLVAVYIGIIILCTTMYTGSILYVAVLEKYPQNEAKASLVFSLNNGFLGVCAPLVTFITNRTSCRMTMAVGAVLLTVAGLISAFMESLDLMLVVYGVFGGVGNAMVGTPFSVVLGLYFKKKRDVVIALSMAMIAFGLLLSVPIVTVSLEKWALNGAFLMIAAINAQLCIVAAICKPSEKEEELLQKRVTKRTNENQEQGRDKVVKEPKGLMYRLKQMKKIITINWNFMFFLLSTFANGIMYSAIYGHLPNYAASLGQSDVNIAILTTCFNVGNAVGRFAGAAMVGISKINNIWTHSLSVGFGGLITLLFPLYNSLAVSRYVFAVLVGACTSIPISLMTPITIELTGVENLAAAHGLEYLYSGLGILVGPPMAGVVYGRTGSYTHSFTLAGSIGIIGCALGAATRMILKLKLNAKHMKCKATDPVDESLLNGV